MNLTDKAIEIYYLDYVNNFLTVSRFAEHYNFSLTFANFIVDKGREINNKDVTDLKAYSSFITGEV